MIVEVNAAGGAASAAEATLGTGLFSWFLSVATQQRLCCCQGEHLVAAVVKMLSSIYMVFDFELAYGRILETL